MSEFLKAIEQTTGESIKYIQDTPLDEQRNKIEKKFGTPMKVVSLFPLIGRKPSSKLITHQEVNRMVDEALKP